MATSFRFVLQCFFLICIVGCSEQSLSITESKSSGEPKQLKPQSKNFGTATEESARNDRLLDAIRGLTFLPNKVLVDSETAKKTIEGLSVDDAKLELKAASKALSNRNKIAAIESLTRAILLDPGNGAYYESLGKVLLSKREYELAESAFRTSLELEPDRKVARVKLAIIQGMTGDSKSAIENYRHAIQVDPQDGEAHGRLAIQLYYANELGSAKEHIHLAQQNDYRVPPQLIRFVNGEKDPAPRGNSLGGLPIIGPQQLVSETAVTPAETYSVSSNFAPNSLVVGWNDRRKFGRTAFAISSDGAKTFGFDFLIRAPGDELLIVESDPMGCSDDRTGDFWAGGTITFSQPLSPRGVFIARKNHGDNSFQPSVFVTSGERSDKALVACGPDPLDTSQSRLYCSWIRDDVNLGKLSYSTNRGDTWSDPPVEFFPPGNSDEVAGATPVVGPDGTLYVFYGDFEDCIWLSRSLDGGQTLEPPILIANRLDFWGSQSGSRFPGSFKVAQFVFPAIDKSNGNLYLAYFDTTDRPSNGPNVDIYFTRSTDAGLTWTPPEIVNLDSSVPGDQFFPAMNVDCNGRINMVYYDTRSVNQKDNVTDDPNLPGAILEAYYAFSDDAGDSWTEMVISPTSFSSEFSAPPNGSEFMGDYIGMGSGGNFSYPTYTSTQDGESKVYVHKIVNTTPCPPEFSNKGK